MIEKEDEENLEKILRELPDEFVLSLLKVIGNNITEATKKHYEGRTWGVLETKDGCKKTIKLPYPPPGIWNTCALGSAGDWVEVEGKDFDPQLAGDIRRYRKYNMEERNDGLLIVYYKED